GGPPHQEAERLALAPVLLVEQARGVPQPGRMDEREQVNPPRGLDPVEPLGRMEEPCAVHLLLWVGGYEGREQSEQVECGQQASAQQAEVAAAELAPEQPRRRLRRQRALSHRRFSDRRPRAGGRRSGSPPPARTPPSGPSP